MLPCQRLRAVALPIFPVRLYTPKFSCVCVRSFYLATVAVTQGGRRF